MFVAAIFASFVLYLIVGIIVSRGVKDTADYYVAGRNAPTFFIVGTLVASFISTVTILGEVGFSYDGYPVALLILVAINVSGYAIGVLLFGRYLRRSGALTVPEYFGKRFDSRAVQVVAGALTVIGLVVYLISVSHGISLVLGQLLDIPEWLILVIVWASYTIFTFLSGSRGVIINDTIMFVIFVGAIVLGMGWVIGSAGGPIATVEQMAQLTEHPDALSWHGTTGEAAYMGSPGDVLLYSITLGLVWAVVVAVSPWQAGRYLMAKNEHVAVRSGMISTATLLVVYIFITFGGFAVNLLNPNIEPSDITFIWLAESFLPAVLGVIAVTGIVAAALSSASTFLSLIGFAVVNDILPSVSSRSREQAYMTTTNDSVTTHISEDDAKAAEVFDKAKLRVSRIAMLGAGLVVLGFSFVTPPAVLEIGYFAATLFAASWGPVAILSTHSSRITARGASLGMIAGFAVAGVLEGLDTFLGIAMPTYLNPVILGMIACILAILIGNYQNQPSVKAIAAFEKIQVIPAHEKSAQNTRTTGVVAWTVMGVCVVVIIVLIVFYAIPYGQLAS